MDTATLDSDPNREDGPRQVPKPQVVRAIAATKSITDLTRSRNHSTDTLRTRRSHRSPSREKRDRRRDDEKRRRSRSRDRGSDRAYRGDRDRSRDRHRDRDRDRDRRRDRHRGDIRDRDRDRERDRDSDRRRKRGDEDDMDGRDSKRKKSADLDDPPPPPGALPPLPRDSPRRRDRSPDFRNGSRDRRMSSPLPPPIKRPSPTYEPPPENFNPDEPREDDSEARSVFVSQLAARLTARDLGYFFEEKLGEGTVMDSRIVTDRMSRRSKGIAYVEFRSVELVDKAIDLTGTVVMGRPIHIQLTESERNKLHPGDGNLNLPPGVSAPHGGAMQLYVGSLHFNLTESDIRQVFEPFGDLEFVDLHKDPTTGRSKGYAFVQYKRSEDAKMALEQMEGFELAGRTLRVNTVHEKGTVKYTQTESLDDSGGGNLNAASRQALMQKLARIEPAHQPEPISRPNIPQTMQSRSVLLKNMFNPEEETEPDWDTDLADDVKGECTEKYGKVEAIKVERETQGEIYLKFDTIESAKKAVQGLNGRWFGGNQVSAAFISDAIMQAHQ
ncbi:hypothetical protein B0H14DRAFT_2556466 [Mycena olivaceomarginata]|nr:hypothetical protein B0H14DRAFT_2556466 [Mycena olivaceomarginata]